MHVTDIATEKRGLGVKTASGVVSEIREHTDPTSCNHLVAFPRPPLAAWETDDMLNTIVEGLRIPYDLPNDSASISVSLASNE